MIGKEEKYAHDFHVINNVLTKFENPVSSNCFSTRACFGSNQKLKRQKGACMAIYSRCLLCLSFTKMRADYNN